MAAPSRWHTVTALRTVTASAVTVTVSGRAPVGAGAQAGPLAAQCPVMISGDPAAARPGGCCSGSGSAAVVRTRLNPGLRLSLNHGECGPLPNLARDSKDSDAARLGHDSVTTWRSRRAEVGGRLG
jgi:hypothetical protein